MTAAPFELPRRYGTTTAARLRRESGPITLKSKLDLLPGWLVSACLVGRGEDGEIQLQRRDTGGGQWHSPTPALLAEWARELRLDADPDDEFAPRMLAAADVAEQVTAEVIALAERSLAPAREYPTLSAAAALARQLTRSRDLLADGDTLFWRLKEVRDPVTGGVGRDPGAPEPGGDRAPAGLLSRLRPDPLAGAEPVTAAVVEHVVRTGGFLAPTAERPAWTDVVAELRRIAGLPATEDASPGTGWLRSRRTGPNTP